MWSIIWIEIKELFKSGKKIFILSILAFTCGCAAVNISLNFYSSMRIATQSAIESYGNKSFYKLVLPGETDVYERVFSDEYLPNIKAAFEQLKSDKAFDYRYNVENLIDFFDVYNSDYNQSDFPNYKEEFLVGYESGEAVIYNDYLTLKAFYVDNLFYNEPYVSLSDGEWFSEDSFYVSDLNSIELPVILGSDYGDLYKLGDKIENAHLGTENSITLNVIGFFTKGSYFYDNNNDKCILDRYMTVPAIETTYNGMLGDKSYDLFTKSTYDGLKITNTRIVFDTNNEEEVLKRVYQILHDNNLYEFRLFDETGGLTVMLEKSKSETLTAMAVAIFIITLIVIMFCIQTYYKILKNKKKFSIFMLNGITRIQLFFIVIIETLMVFVLSTILFGILYGLFYNSKYIDLGLNNYAFIIIPIIELALTCFIGIFGVKKIQKTNMSSTLREHE